MNGEIKFNTFFCCFSFFMAIYKYSSHNGVLVSILALHLKGFGFNSYLRQVRNEIFTTFFKETDSVQFCRSALTLLVFRLKDKNLKSVV